MKTLDLEVLFRQALDYRDKAVDIETLGPWLRDQIISGSFPNLSHIPLQTEAYTRHCIARESIARTSTDQGQNFEALVIRWDHQAKTSVHGHPAFSFYHVISGLFQMECFSYSVTQGLQLMKTKWFYPADTIWFWGQPGRYDNFIHRVTCLEPGFTFHIYSEDAQKGILL